MLNSSVIRERIICSFPRYNNCHSPLLPPTRSLRPKTEIRLHCGHFAFHLHVYPLTTKKHKKESCIMKVNSECPVLPPSVSPFPRTLPIPLPGTLALGCCPSPHFHADVISAPSIRVPALFGEGVWVIGNRFCVLLDREGTRSYRLRVCVRACMCESPQIVCVCEREPSESACVCVCVRLRALRAYACEGVR